MENKKKQGRTRNYATVVYPESAPSNWLELLSDTHVPCIVSPLHDKDTNPSGEQKKPHHHVMLLFDSVKTVEQADEVFKLIGGVGHETVQSTRGYARYLCHLDNPEKAQYSVGDIRAFNGVDYDALIGLPSDKYKAIGEMIDFCECNDVKSYAQLLNWSRVNKYDWFKVLCDSGTYVIKEYLKSRTWSDLNELPGVLTTSPQEPSTDSSDT